MIVLVVVATAMAAGAIPAAAQTSEWTLVDNPYQEDVEYTIGDTFNPGIVVEGVRWHSFTVAEPDRQYSDDRVNVSTELLVEFENRGSKALKVLVILLLEDADGNPLERIEVRPFKAPGGRMKERTEKVSLSGATLKSTERVYLFFEIMD
jgi:hypothetical protein